MLSTIEARLAIIITQIAILINPIALIQRLVQITAKETTPYFIENQLNAVATNVTNLQAAVTALTAQVATFQATTALDFTAVLAAIGSPQQNGVPVTLPVIPPAGYQAPSVSDNAAGVWATLTPDSRETVLVAVDNSAAFAENIGNSSWLNFAFAPYFWLETDWWQKDEPLDSGHTPQPQAATILSTDTLLTWLTREEPLITWVMGGQGADFVSGETTTSSGFWVCKLSISDFAALKAQFYPTAAVDVVPVWPGLAGVTLGATVALADGLVVTGPLSGVIVVISSVPNPISYYPFGTIKSYVRAGAIVFTDDNGDSEFPQPFGPDHLLILPKSMTEAESATVRLPSGIVGTIQAFTIP